MKSRLTSKQSVVVYLSTAVALLLYALGLKFLYFPFLVGMGAWLLPLPKIFNSWLGRVVASTLLLLAVIQLGASLQFLIIPKTGFLALAIITWILFLIIYLLAPKQTKLNLKIINSSDICALLIIVCFLLPFTPIIAGRDSTYRVALIGSTQAIDATNHYATIAELTRAQHLNYAPGYYYPKGFHIAAGFVQNTLFGNQYQLGFKGNAILFFTDYLFYGSLLGYVLFFICLSWLKALNKKMVSDSWHWSRLLTAACLAPPLVILYLIPFISEGFLSYYYVCITLVLGLIFLGELTQSVKDKNSSLDLKRDPYGRFMLLAYLILLYGASATWPLLIPPFVLIGFMFLLPSKLNWKVFIDRVLNVSGLPVIAAFILQLIPIYFQMKYSTTGTAASINLTGGLKQFHPYVIFAGLLIIFALVMSAKVEESFKRILINIFLPLMAFLTVLMIFQYFTVGTILYYVIKVSLLVEMLMLALGVAVLIWIFINSRVYEARYAWLLPIIPLAVIMLLISSVDNPLKDIRDVFRNRSNDVIPQYLGQDDQTDVRLGMEGKLKHFNMTVLHYNPTQGKFFADMQVPYWADMMQYDASKADFDAAQCVGQIYGNLAFGTYDAAAQASLTVELKACAENAAKRGETFYVVTDPASAPHVRKLLGNLVTVVID